jgi:signal transduction histidine kinase
MNTRRSPGEIITKAFPGITPEEVQKLVSRSTVNNYASNVVLCQEDALETTFYMILEGQVEVSKTINKTEARLLKILGPGDFFGEMALVHNAPRAATVKTKTDLVALELDKDSFEEVLENSNSISMAMVREISNRLRENDEMAIEDLRMRARELALAYQKLAEQDLARREFLTNVAHELRTPLMAASGYIQILEKGMLNDQQFPQAIATVSKHIQQIVSLVNDILFMQEMDLVLPEFKRVNLQDIVARVLEEYQSKARARSVQFRVITDPDLPDISGDYKSLERALSALVDNAIKFSPQGGKVEVRLNHKNGEITVSVEDHGIGISEAILPQIFEKFFHLDRNGENLFGGIGIGLAIARQVIHQHKGSIEVISEPDQGSTFIMHLESDTLVTSESSF